MTIQQAKLILDENFQDLQTAADARNAILDIQRGRQSFTEDEFSTEDYNEQLEAAHFLAINLPE